MGNAIVGAGLFQHRNHLCDGDHVGIIIHRIDFSGLVPSAGHFVYAGPPIQGCFAHVISGYIEDDPGRIGRMDRSGGRP